MNRLRTEQRIRKRQDFQMLFEKGRFAKGTFLNLRVCEQTPEQIKRPMLGIMVSRKTNQSAARRNLWKRRIREVFRKKQDRIRAHLMILIQSRIKTQIPTLREIDQEIETLLNRTKSLK